MIGLSLNIDRRSPTPSRPAAHRTDDGRTGPITAGKPNRCSLGLFTFYDLVFVLGVLGASARSRLKRYSKQWKHNLD